MTIESVLARLHHVKRVRGEYRACCPAHEDSTPSLSLTIGDKGGIIMHCHAGCATTDIVTALGLTMTDLRNGDAPRSTNGAALDLVYPYVDEQGLPLFEVVRTANPKRFRQRRPNGTWGIDGVRRVLYRLPSVIAAAESGQRVYVVEGEKDADRLADC